MQQSNTQLHQLKAAFLIPFNCLGSVVESLLNFIKALQGIAIANLV